MAQPPEANNRGKMTAMGQVDTSNMMMIIRWVLNISSRLPTIEWASSTHTTPYIAQKIRKVTEIINYILDTLPTEYTMMFVLCWKGENNGNFPVKQNAI